MNVVDETRPTERSAGGPEHPEAERRDATRGGLGGEPPKRDDWDDAEPRHIPSPTAWPAGMAFGTTIFFWGLVTSLVLVFVGLAVMAVSLAGWIGEMRDEG